MGDYTDSPSQSASSSAMSSASPASSILASNPPTDPVIPDSNRPDSTILAGSPHATPSAKPAPADSQVQPVPTPELQPNLVLEGSASASIIPPADSTSMATGSADLQPATPISPQSPESPQLSDTPAPTATPAPEESQSLPVSVSPEAPKESSIQDTSQPNPPPQVQQDVQVSAPSESSVPVDQSPKESATIEPKPLDDTQNTISADSKPLESPKSSSFGDLIANPSDLSEEPAIHIDPIESPKSTPEQSTFSSPNPSISVDQQGEASDQRRLHANEVRKQKKEDNLGKILEFVQQKGKASNFDIRDFLHVSQSTTTGYLRILVNSGKLKKEGKAKATKYFL